MNQSYLHLPHCGCWVPGSPPRQQKTYIPLIDLRSHTTILSTASRTTIYQTFVNPRDTPLESAGYIFPLYDGVSVVGFKCTVGSHVLVGKVKEKERARKDYNEAVARGETAGLLEQHSSAADVFTTKIGNIPANEKVFIEVSYIGELKHDAETDGARFTIPTVIAPRYGSTSFDSAGASSQSQAVVKGGISISVDVKLDDSTIIRGVQSPSHPIAVTMGRDSTMVHSDEDDFDNTRASAQLTLQSTELGADFVLVVLWKNSGAPRAMLETHPSIGSRAIMATLVPKFNLPNIIPEIVFVIDRSGSMSGKMQTVVSALKIFLKSLPANGVKFNICSFGSHYSFLFERSMTYDESSLNEALKHVESLQANYGGTEMLDPIVQAYKQRYQDLPLEIILATDGQIWNQKEMFEFIGSQENARLFSLGIGSGTSSSLVEGAARAGGGFAQFVDDNEKMDKRVIRMLKVALSPHITDYNVTVKYREDEKDDFEMVTPPSGDSSTIAFTSVETNRSQPISLYNDTFEEEPTNPTGADRYDGLPNIATPGIIQAPAKIPTLYTFNRTTVYLLLKDTSRNEPISLILRGTSEHGPVELEMPIQDVGSGNTIHLLAAKKTTQELEEGRGWLTNMKNANGELLKSTSEGKWDLIVERECVRLGTTYGVAGKYTSFVAVDEQNADIETATEYELVDSREPSHEGLFGARGGARRCRPSHSAQAPAPTPGGGGGGLFGAVRSVAAPAASLFGRSADPKAEATYSSAASPGPAASTLPSTGAFAAHSNTDPSAFGRPGGPQLQQYRARNVDLDKSKQPTVDFMSVPDTERLEGRGFKVSDDRPDANLDTQTQVQQEVARLHQLIGMQRFDGSWEDHKSLWALLGTSLEEVRRSFTALGKAENNVLATVAAVAWFNVVRKEDEELWEMVVEKAWTWLAGKGVDADDAVASASSLFESRV